MSPMEDWLGISWRVLVAASRSISCDIDGKTVTVEYDDAKTKPQAHFQEAIVKTF